MMRAAGCLSETVSLLTPSVVVVDGGGGGGGGVVDDVVDYDVALLRMLCCGCLLAFGV
jgi:acetyl-CoA carboxylase alpha subunit